MRTYSQSSSHACTHPCVPGGINTDGDGTFSVSAALSVMIASPWSASMSSASNPAVPGDCQSTMAASSVATAPHRAASPLAFRQESRRWLTTSPGPVTTHANTVP